MNNTNRNTPLQTDMVRLRRHIDNLNLLSDNDSEYANHPPPTDSEVEIEMNPAFILPRRYDSNNNINSSMNRIMNRSNNSSLQSSGNNSSINLTNDNNHNNHNNHNNSSVSGNLLAGSSSTAMEDLYKQRNKLKSYGLKRLNIRQHIIVTICRDIPIYSMLKNFIVLISQWYKLMKIPYNNITTVRATEFFLASIWCLVSAMLSYTILDSLMVRWMLMYDIQAVIVRILSMSLIIVMVVEMFNYTFNNLDNEFCLTVWIFISCVLTLFFIIQCFLSNNLGIEENLKLKEISSIELSRNRTNTSDGYSSNNSNSNNEDITTTTTNNNNISNNNNHLGKSHSRCNSGITENDSLDTTKNKFKRKIDLYNLVVFAVVPIGVASFVSMVGLVRLLLIMRLDIGIEMSRIQQNS